MRIPKLRRHATGQATARINAKDYYFGVWGTKEAQKRYDAKIAEWPAAGRKEAHAKLLVIDPFMAYLDGLDAVKDQDVRKALHLFARTAERLQCAIILLRHLNKAGGNKAIYRGGGSIGIIGAARSAILVAVNPDNEEERIIASTKNNLAKRPDSLMFTLQQTDNDSCKLVWSGTSKLTADEVLAANNEPEEKNAVDEAADFLHTLLAEAPMPLETIRSAGIAERTIRRAKKKLAIKAYKQGFDSGTWYWKLPGHDAQLTIATDTWPPSTQTAQMIGATNDESTPFGDAA